MHDNQGNKALVSRFYDALDSAHPTQIASVMAQYMSPEYHFRGVHPFNELHGSDSVAETLWRPLRGAFCHLQRRPDIFMAGESEVDGTCWTCSMGNLMGLFDHPWLGIPPTGKMAFLRYADFSRIDRGCAVETGFFCDVLGVMKQAGLSPLPLQTGVELLVPGPRTHDGLLMQQQNALETARTIALVNLMKDDLVGSDEGFGCPDHVLARTWHDDMIWFGPSGIGSTYTIRRYQEQHQDPFRRGLGDVVFNGHVSRFAEGHYAGWFGWPNLTMTPTGGFLGLPASDRRIHMRVVDIYRREKDKLAENWIFIDLLYWLLQQGVDVLERMQGIGIHDRSDGPAPNLLRIATTHRPDDL